MLQVIYQDDYLLAVNKPCGLLSVPGRGDDKQDCVVSRLQKIVADVRVVHRLDCHTSGVMLLAIGIDAQRALSRLFHDREIDKDYVALVEGRVEKVRGRIDVPMRGDPDNRPKQLIDYLHGKAAQTEWRLLKHEHTDSGIRSRLRLCPLTGRTHQLRLHCVEMAHPIIGDRLYNGQSAVNASRMMLHAEQLCFSHPVTGKSITISCKPEF